MNDRPIEDRLAEAFGADMNQAERSWLDGRVRTALATAELARPSRKRFAGSLLLVGVLLVLAPAVLAVGAGILPLRTATASITPSQQAGTPSLTLYAHLEGTVNPTKPYPKTQWFAMARGGTVDPYRAIGFDYDGVGCFDVEAGDQLGLYDRNPADSAAQQTQLIARVEQLPTVVWVDITQSGSLTLGTGVPSWWSGPAQECGGASPAPATQTPTPSVLPSPVPSIAEDSGCGPSTIELPDASFVPYSPGSGSGQPNGGLIKSAPPATVADGQAHGFLAYIPTLAGYDYSYLILNTNVFETFLSRNPITAQTRFFPFYQEGGATISEQKNGAENFATRLGAHLDRVSPVAIGTYQGYVRRDDELLPGFRPFYVMWTQGATYFEMYSGAASAADAVNLARSTVCTGDTPITEAAAIAIASHQVKNGSALLSAEHGPYAQMVDQGRVLPSGLPQQSQREVWAVTFSVVFDDICPPDGSACKSPRPGTLTVFIDYVTGELIGTSGYAPNPN